MVVVIGGDASLDKMLFNSKQQQIMGDYQYIGLFWDLKLDLVLLFMF